MGKLRKIGRKLKKGIKKLFSSPLGGILGSMAINFMFGGVLSNFFKGAFKGAKGALGFGDAAAQAGLEGAKLTAEVGVEAGKLATGAADKLAQSTLSEGTKNITASTFNSAIEKGVTPIDKAINVNNVLAEGVSNGTIKPTVNNSITQTLSETANIVEKGVPDSLFEEGLFDSGGNLVAEQGATFAQAASDPTKFARLQEGSTFGEKVGRFASDPIGLTAKGAKNLAGSAVKGVTSGEFVGDVATGVTSSLIMQEVMGEPEQPFVSRGVQPSSPMEMAQGSYIQDIAPSYAAATNTTRVPSFQEISQQTLYGTGTPQYMSQFYQPLASPTVTG